MSRDKKEMILQVTALAEEANCQKLALHGVRCNMIDLKDELMAILAVMTKVQLLRFWLRCGEELKYESKVEKIRKDVDHLESQLAQLILTQENCEILPKDRMAALSITYEGLLSWPRPKLDLLMGLNKGRSKLYQNLMSAESIFCDILQNAITAAEELIS